MKRLVDILFFWFKVMFVVFMLTSTIAFVLLLLAGGWGDVTLLDRLIYALLSGVANGIVLGTLVALFMGWQTWRVVQKNKKKLALRKEGRKEAEQS